MSPRTLEEWTAALGRLLGIVGLVFCAVVWLLTDRVEPLLVTTFGSLLAIGQGAQAIATLRHIEPPPPPTIPPSPPGETLPGDDPHTHPEPTGR